VKFRVARVCAALAVVCAGSVSAWAADPTFVGNWDVTFYLEPNRAVGATQCIVVTSAPGTVAGVPTSGTWSSPTFAGWHGQWVELGDHVRWFGVTGGGLSTEESGNVIQALLTGGVSFNHFLSSSGSTSSAGSWVAEKVTACRAGTAQLRSSDPSQ
jgi:hypothetical protein